MKRFLAIIILSTFLISSYSVNPLHFFNFSLTDGLSQITVTSIYQDKQGYMWFGTRNGLNQFNGYQFNTFLFNAENINSISDNHILCITETNDNNLWIGTNNGLNKLDLQTNTFTRYFNIPGSNLSLSNNMVTSLYCDVDNNLWIGTNNGLNLYDKNKDLFTTIDINDLTTNIAINTIVRHKDKLYLGTASKGLIIYNIKDKTHSVYNLKNSLANNIRVVTIDKKDNIWIGTDHYGVFRLFNDSLTNYNTKNGLTNNSVRCIAQSPDGNILVGTFNGLNIIDPQNNNITQYKTYGSDESNLSHYSIYSIFYDKSTTLWIGTYAGGINYYSPYGEKFKFTDPSNILKSIVGIIGPMLEIKNNLYIATEGGGLLEVNKQTNDITTYKIFNDKEDLYTKNILKSLYYDGQNILCGTNLGTIYSFDIITKKFKLIYSFEKENSIYHISKNSNEDIVIGGVNQIGMTILSANGKTISKHPITKNKTSEFFNVRCIYKLKENVYLVGTRNDGLYYYDQNNEEVEHFEHDASKFTKNQLPDNYVTNIFRDSNQNIWIGTFGGGLSRFDLKTKSFETYNVKNGLLDNNVCSIVEDNNMHLWISSMSGISDLDITTKAIVNYSHSSGIRIKEFTPHAGIKLSDGKIMFSGNNGYISFNPRNMSVNPFIPPIVLNNLYINNEKVMVGASNKILDKQLNSQKKIVLTYEQAKNISIEYSALNYIFPNRNEYTYMLEGFDKKWNKVGNRRIAYYTNISPGEYVFKVRGSNNDGVWNQEGTSIIIKVLPPFWLTWWAFVVYIILIIVVAYLILRYLYEKKRLEDKVKLEQAQSKAREEFHEARNNLFTNFSHELRTPLTLIISPLEDMVQNETNLPEKIKQNHQLIYSNSQRLLRLVNNLMDFQKRESGNLKLKISKDNFIIFSEEMVSLFYDLAKSRNINLSFHSNDESIEYWFDKSLMEKVYFNLLSNALKNTPNNGNITVDIQTETLLGLKATYPQKTNHIDTNAKKYILLKIKDSGIGIEASELEKIFIPFYQVAQNEHSSSGTGLGLSLSKAIIEMHKGTIWTESTEGTGATFICILPVIKPEDNNQEAINTINNETYTTNILAKPELKENIYDHDDSQKSSTSILVVEDNIDVRKYIVSHLSNKYIVSEASNGAEAIEKAINNLPDLIISDLMMPKMNGMEMTQILKTDLRTSHIPIIMLTAKTMNDDIKKGYENGADDYITKPFNSAILVARVNNIIRSREKLKEIYGKRFTIKSLGVETTSLDDRFMQKLYQVIENNVANPELKLDGFSKEIGMSKANLYRKIKALTDLSPNEFIRNFRLEMAAKILKESDLPISEVYVAVGFNSHAYFSNCFKAFYGVTPSEYASQNTSGEAQNNDKS